MAIEKMSYEEKEKRLDEILNRLDNAETPIDALASEAKEAAALIKAMNNTLINADKELTEVFKDLEKVRKTDKE